MLQRLELVLDDVVDGLPVGPSSMPAGMLAVFHEQVARFLKGSHTDVDLDTVRIAIEAGSYKVIVPMVALVTGLASDVAMLSSGNLDDIDAKRALVVEEWQKAARMNVARRYRLAVDGMAPGQIHAGSDFVRQVEFVHQQASFDAEAFAAMVAKGRKAWADVPNASDWVEEQRGAA